MTPAATRPPLDPDRDTARDLVSSELNKPDYNRAESLVARLRDWLLERWDALTDLATGSSPVLTVLVVLVLTALVTVVVAALRGRRRGGVLREGAGGGVIDDPALTAEDYRRRVAGAAQRGDWDQVLLDSYRAISVDATRRTVLEEAPGLTAHEIGRRLATAFPGHEGDLLAGADAFDRVRYGGRTAHRDQAQALRALDGILTRTTARVETLV